MPSSGSTYKNNLHMVVRHGGKNLATESDLQLREGWAALRGQSWPAVGGGGMKEKEMERGEGKRGRGRSRAIQWCFDLTTPSPLKTFCQEKLAINTYNLLSEPSESPGPGVNSPIAMSLNQL